MQHEFMGWLRMGRSLGLYLFYFWVLQSGLSDFAHWLHLPDGWVLQAIIFIVTILLAGVARDASSKQFWGE